MKIFNAFKRRSNRSRPALRDLPDHILRDVGMPPAGDRARVFWEHPTFR